jgi:glycosyltransferase involved in cell wall biosynthesis
MNILILNWRDPQNPASGGAEISLLEHAKYWAKKGANITWFASSFKNALENEKIKLSIRDSQLNVVQEGIQKRSKKYYKNTLSSTADTDAAMRQERDSGIKIIRKGSYYTVHLWAYRYYKQKKFGNPDIIIDCFHFLPFFTTVYTKNKKIIALINEPAKNAWFKNIFFPLNLIGFLVEPLFFIPYKKIPFITASESIAKELINYNLDKKKINIVQHGYYPRAKNINYKKEQNPVIIYLAQIAPDKGIEDAIKAFAIIYKKNSDAKFWIVGKAKNEEYLVKIIKIIKKKKLTTATSYFGFVTEKQKYELLARAWILVHPSSREGWGLNVIEANAMGTPAVGYNVVGLKDSIKNNLTGLLVEQNSKALAAGIYKLVTDKKLYQTMSDEGEKWAKNFDWEISTKKSWEIISSISKL